MVGDNLSDIQAGKAAGCRTILIGTMKCDLCRLMSENNIFPDKIVGNIAEAVRKQIFEKEYLASLPEA